MNALVHSNVSSSMHACMLNVLIFKHLRTFDSSADFLLLFQLSSQMVYECT